MNKIIGYFQFDEEEFSVGIVLKDFWDKNKGLDDQSSESKYIPEGFYELSEAIYEHEYSDTEEAKNILNKAGFIEKELFPKV